MEYAAYKVQKNKMHLFYQIAHLFFIFYFLKILLQEYSLITNKHNLKLINILENQKMYGLIFLFSIMIERSKNDTSEVKKGALFVNFSQLFSW